jgi:WD40 repeat protein/predicted Ser/Thr protein kinase
LVSRYVIQRVVGTGGMGLVYEAYDPELDRKVAVKLLRKLDAAGADALRTRLLREAQSMARLTHPNVVAVYDVGAIDGQVFIVMELVQGSTLKRWLHEKKHSLSEVLKVFKQAGQGLAAAHAVDLVHRDFKPDNVLIASDGRVLVTDFGLARSSGADSAAPDGVVIEPARLTRTGALIGTPAYMSPEQLDGVEVTARSDLFSFCVALYEALYQERPFAGENVGAVREAIVRGHLREPPRDTRVPSWLRGVLRRGLDGDPLRRQGSMVELLAELAHDPAALRRRAMTAIAVLAALLVAASVFLQRIAHERDLARAAQVEAETGRNQLLLAQARLLVEKRPTEAVAYLKRYAESSHADWSSIWTIAAEARSRIVARHVFHGFTGAQVSPDGRHAAGTKGDQLLLLDTLSGSAVVLRGGAQRIHLMVLSNAVLASADDDGKISRWELSGGAERELGTAGEKLERIALSDGGELIATSGASGTIRVFDESGRVTVLRGHHAPARMLVFDSRATLLASVADDSAIRLWSLAEGTERMRIEVPSEFVRFSPDGKTLAAGANDGKIWLIDVKSGARRVLEGHKNLVGYLVFSSDGKTLYSGSSDGTARVWDVARGTQRLLEGEGSLILPLALSNDQRRLAAADVFDKRIRVWDLALRERLVLTGHDEAIRSMAFTSDGRDLVSADFGGQINVGENRLLEFDGDGHELTRYEKPAFNEPMAVSSDGGLVAVAAGNGDLRLFRAGEREPLILVGHKGGVNVMTFSTDRRLLASAGYDRVIRVWSTSDGKLVRELRGHVKNIWRLELSPDGKELASAAGDERRLMLWNLETGASRELPTPGQIFCISYSGDGRWLAWAAGDSTARVLSRADGSVRELTGHRAMVHPVLFSPDSTMLLTGSDDRTARLWSTSDWSFKSLPNEASVYIPHFSADGRTLILLCSDHSIHVWNPAHAAELYVFRAEHGDVNGGALSASGRYLAASFVDEPFARLWSLDVAPPEASQRWLDQLTSAVLSPEAGIVSPMRIAR